jgi:hypothetical protein
MQKTLVTVVGGIIMAVGMVMLVTPGPGLVVLAVGLAVLGREYHWARRLQARVLAKLGRKPKSEAGDVKPTAGDKR